MRPLHALIALVVMTGFPALGAALGFAWDGPWPNATTIESLVRANGARLLWWNIHDGRSDGKHAPSLLSQNLIRLIHSEIVPDVMAFAEYRDASLTPDCLTALRHAYPHVLQQAHPGTPGYGLAVYSRLPIIRSSVENLDFTPPEMRSVSEQARFRAEWCSRGYACARSFIVLELDWAGTQLTFEAVHLYDFWRAYRQRYGLIRTGQEILLGRNNALWHQISRFRAALEARLGDTAHSRQVVILGDFNIPKRLLGIETLGYQLLAQGWVEPFAGDQVTFPALSAEEYGRFPPVGIDHAFVSRATRVSAQAVLPLRGSTHYPLYVVVSRAALP
jgi:endonuclease/exonuclease/phosphatase family metal-dependent hydrolase